MILVFESQDGFAALPGGTSESEETPEETAIRESLEETGLRINIEKPVTFYNLTVFNKDGTERCRFYHYLFLASTRDTNPKPNAEWRDSNARCKWVTLDGLRRYKGIWPLPESVKKEVSEGNLNMGNLGELIYQMQ
jgi:8-oxo-dGTP pyrophosphatase MutT (NUDIX family)